MHGNNFMNDSLNNNEKKKTTTPNLFNIVECINWAEWKFFLYFFFFKKAKIFIQLMNFIFYNKFYKLEFNIAFVKILFYF